MNLGTGIMDLQFNYAQCYFNEGALRDIIDCGDFNKDPDGAPIDESGSKFKYRCPFPECPKHTSNRAGNKSLMGLREYSIHCAVTHFQLEVAMADDKRPGIEEVRAAIIQYRRKQGNKYEPMPELIFEEVHTCLLCNGENKEGQHLSFDEAKINSLKYHYASCYYDSGVYLKMYPPGEKNSDEKGNPVDVLGTNTKYDCTVSGCSIKRKMGYKAWAVHMAHEHGGVLTVMSNDSNDAIKAVGRRLEAIFK